MRIISLLAYIFWLPASVKAVERSPSMATRLADHYLKSFVEGVRPLPDAKQAKKKHLININITEVQLSPREERAVVLNQIFAKSSYYRDQYQQVGSVLNPYAWSDLHLFCGTTATPAYHFLSRINKTITVLGEGALASLIGAPTANLEVLAKRQRFISLLCQDDQVYSDLRGELQHYKASEKALLSFWTETDPLYSKEYDKYLTRLFYTSTTALNKLAGPLQRRKVWLRDIWNIYANYVWYPLVMGLPLTEMLACSVRNIPRGTFYKYCYPFFLPGYTLFHVPTLIEWTLNEEKKEAPGNVKQLNAQPNGLRVGFYFYSVGVTLHSFWQYYKGYRNYKEYSGVLKNLAWRMADLQTFLITAKKINALVQQNPDLEALYGPQLGPIRALLARANESSEVGNLLRYLEELPLRAWSYLWDNAGKLLAGYKLFVEHKAVFHDAMYALGELDAFLSMATLIKETAAMNGVHAYTFTKFLSSKTYTKPRLALVAMWNPMLTPATAVGNDVTMDQETQNIILTGPNAGGKSTFLTGVATTVLLSQAFGVAPAKSCAMTPFSKINTYIDITDDIAAGKSLFLAEVDRFQAHLNVLKQLKAQEFGFTIFDEPFSGTNPVEGAAAEYSILNYISKYSNALNIVATHYPMMMLLEQREPKKGFKNYKVFIKPMGKDRKIQYTYKVVPGASNQAIAIDILEEQGYATEMLQQARDIMNHPERYRKSFSK